MKINDDAKLDMYNAVISHCGQHPEIMASLPALQETFNAFKDTVVSINNTSQQKAKVISGITEDKHKLRKLLAQQSADIAFKIFAYATSVTNNELKQQVNFSRTTLLKLKDEDLFNICKNITDLVNSHLPALASYGITADTIKNYNGLITEYRIAVPRPRNAVSSRTSHVKLLKESFLTADDILKSRLDKIIATLKVSDSEFCMAYQSNRIIVDPRRTVTQVKGTITDNITNKPISGVKAEIAGTSVMAITGDDGKYILKPITHGVHSVMITKDGFHQKTIVNLTIKLGQVNTVDTSLTPAA